MKFCVVAIDYITKWVEASPLRNIAEEDTKKFFWESVVLRFGIPRVLISDNGTQFVGKKFKAFLGELGIRHRTSSVGHPQANGQVEVTNRSLLSGIKKRLDDAKGRWGRRVDERMWAFRTTPRTVMGETPFKLAYGTEALIPLKIGITSDRVKNFDEVANEEGIRLNLDLLDEARDKTVSKIAAYQ